MTLWRWNLPVPLCCLVSIVLGLSQASAATFVIRYSDPPGTGFLDPSPAAPSPGNPGTTLGQQRRNAIEHAASVWGAVLTSDTSIIVNARFTGTLECSATTAVLGGATSTILFSSFSGAPDFGVWYPAALADALAGRDLCADPESHCAGEADITAVFNPGLDSDSQCLGGKRRWYYGLDHRAGDDGIDFLNVVLHELAHGLGFQTFVNEKTGTWYKGKPVAYDRFLRDLATGHKWTDLTPAQRRISARSDGNVVWDGDVVAEAARSLTSGTIDGYTSIYSPDPPREGASLSHWDTSVTPDELMEPQLSDGLRASSRLGLAPCLLADLGWRLSQSGACNGTTPQFRQMLVSATDLDLGDETPGQTVASTVRVTNPSTLPFVIDTVGSRDGLGDPFAIGSENCSGSKLPPGGECSIQVTFSPTDHGTFEDRFSLSSADTGPGEMSIRVTGRGTSDTRPVPGSLQSPALVSSGGGGLGLLTLQLLFLVILGGRIAGRRQMPRPKGFVIHPATRR